MTEHKEGKCHLPNTDCDTVIIIGMEMSSKQRLPSHLGKLKIFPANIAKPIVENSNFSDYSSEHFASKFTCND